MDEHNHVSKRRRLTSFLGPNDENMVPIADPEDEFQQVNILRSYLCDFQSVIPNI